VVQDLCVNVLLTLLIWIPGEAAAEAMMRVDRLASSAQQSMAATAVTDAVAVVAGGASTTG
jgi:hypothetical protein